MIEPTGLLIKLWDKPLSWKWCACAVWEMRILERNLCVDYSSTEMRCT